MFSKDDLEQMKRKGIEPSAAEKQLSYFCSGFPYLDLDRPATINDGIIKLSEEEVELYSGRYDKEGQGMTIEKFVPASGAATRMFKDLFSFIDESPDLTLEKLYEKYPSVKEVIERAGEFAFFGELKNLYSRCDNVNSVNDAFETIRAIISEKGLNYGNLPKGLLAFHKYSNGYRTSFGEHLAEGGLYAVRDSGTSHIHFTVTPEHKELFRKHLKEIIKGFEGKFNITFEVSFSEQSPSTDTIAADMENKPFRDNNGKLVFRPAGHGALLHNLNQVKSEIIFIKNIDNVVPDGLKVETVRYKKAIAGILLENVSAVHGFMDLIEKNGLTPGILDEIRVFYRKNFFTDIPATISKDEMYAILNRPLRVCGMVKNQGEPGGGPFWVRGANGSSSLQIVESSQVEKGNAVFSGSTHFNPVDLVCFVYDNRGRKYDLPDFTDPNTGFISVKSQAGKSLKAMELPGLWNGAMANWNTVFVEVPLITFNPVKTINDLLRNEHLLH